MAYADWSPAAIKSALMTTAYNLDNAGRNIKDLASGDKSSPFVHRAGHVDPNRAPNPGLVYNIDVDDYVGFLCAISYEPRRIAVFLREPMSSNVCAHRMASLGELNYPSFSVVLKPDGDVVKYRRVVKNVGCSAEAVCEVKVNAPENVEVSVSPSKLAFSAENRLLSYKIKLSSIVSGLSTPRFGLIKWTDGTHQVRSPIAVRWRQELVESI